jgi:thimet oligopeptidase
VHPDTAFRDHATAMTTKVSVAATALSLNRSVYQALAALDLSNADSPTRSYVQRQLLEFRQAGVDKSDTTRKRLKELNEKLTEELSMFDRNISDDQAVVEVSDVSQLEGLSQDYIATHKPINPVIKPG